MSVTSVGVAHNVERVSPVIECGKVAFQVKISKQTQKTTQTSQRNHGGGIAVTNSDGINFTNELNNVSNHLKFALTAKYNPNWSKVGTALKNRSFNEFVYALMPTLELTAKGKRGLKFPFGEIAFQAGIDFKHLPILFRGFITPRSSVAYLNKRLIITLNVGPSLQGWLDIIHRFGPQALNSFLAGNNAAVLRNVMTTLASSGVFIATSTVVVSFGLFSLMALYAGHRARKGEMIGLSTWYVSAYYRKITLAGVIDGTRKKAEDLKNDYINGDRVLRDKIVDAAIADALKDARNHVQKNNIKNIGYNDEISLMGIWSQALKNKHKTKTEYDFKKAIDKDLTQKAKMILNR